MIYFSVIIPLKDEEKSIPVLHEELIQVFSNINKPYEIIFIDDGSIDNSYSILTTLQKKDKNIKVIKFRANFGKSAALSAGFKEAKGNIIIMLDADLQDNPNEIPKLLQKLDEGYDLVSGWRQKRNDSIVKRISSLMFNKGTALVTNLSLHDLNCGLKVFKKNVAEQLYLHGELHRFIPVLAYKKKFKVAEVIVNHRPRRYGSSKYGKSGIGRSWKGIVDLLTTLFITEYSTKPAHFFGKIGIILFSAGFFMDLYVTYIKISTGTTQGRIPLLLAGIFLMLLAIQLISTGLIAEMIAYYFDQKKNTDQLLEQNNDL